MRRFPKPPPLIGLTDLLGDASHGVAGPVTIVENGTVWKLETKTLESIGWPKK